MFRTLPYHEQGALQQFSQSSPVSHSSSMSQSHVPVENPGQQLETPCFLLCKVHTNGSSFCGLVWNIIIANLRGQHKALYHEDKLALGQTCNIVWDEILYSRKTCLIPGKNIAFVIN